MDRPVGSRAIVASFSPSLSVPQNDGRSALLKCGRRHSGLLLRFLLGLVVFAWLAPPLGAAGWNMYFYGYQTTLLGPYNATTNPNGLTSPFGVAVDGSGNVYVVGGQNVLKLPWTGSGYGTPITVPSGMSTPKGVAVDSSGNVYISTESQVLEVPWTGSGYGAVSSLLGGAIFDGLAVDASGNLYFGDHLFGQVVKVQTAYASTFLGGLQPPCSSANLPPCRVSTATLDSPYGVAVDSSGNVFIADHGNSHVYKEVWNGDSYTEIAGPSVFSSPWALAVDANDNLYIADSYSTIIGTGDDGRVVMLPWPGSTTPDAGTLSLVASGDVFLPYEYSNADLVLEPVGVAVDASGTNIYISESGNMRLLKVQLNSGDFGAVNLGSSADVAMIFRFAGNVPAGFPSGFPTPAEQVLTLGAASPDFTDAGTGTCANPPPAADYSFGNGDHCTVDVVFTPQAAGLRSGAVMLVDQSIGYLYGAGMAPQVTFGPGALSTIASNLVDPVAVAVDSRGAVYIADSGATGLTKVQNGASTALECFALPQGLAVEGSGLVYESIDNAGSSTVYGTIQNAGELSQNGNSPELLVVSGSGGLNNPQGLAVDGMGNLFIADTGNNRVVEVPWTGNPVTQMIGNCCTVVNPVVGAYDSSSNPLGVSQPTGEAVDSSGNLYIADTGNQRVLQVPWTASGYGPPVLVLGGLNKPVGVAVDASGSVYISDSTSSLVLQVPWTGSAYGTPSILLSGSNGLKNPRGIALDSHGNLYVADSGNNRVLELDLADAPSLSFPSTSLGSSSAPQSVVVGNAGNAQLTISQISTPTDFS